MYDVHGLFKHQQFLTEEILQATSELSPAYTGRCWGKLKTQKGGNLKRLLLLHPSLSVKESPSFLPIFPDMGTPTPTYEYFIKAQFLDNSMSKLHGLQIKGYYIKR